MNIYELISKDCNSLGRLCRICLTTVDGNALNLFDSKNVEVQDKIRFFTKSQINHSDGTPSLICLSCLTELDQANNFRLKCLHSEDILHKLLSHGINSDVTLETKEIKIEFTEENNVSEDLKSHLPSRADIVTHSPNDGIELKQESCSDEYEEEIITSECDLTGGTRAEPRSRKKRAQNKIRKLTNNKLDDDKAGGIGGAANQMLESVPEKQIKKRGRKETLNFNGSIVLVGAEKRYQCLECAYNTPYKKTLIYHVRTHTGEKPYVCEICDKGFSQPGSLASHRKLHSDKMYFTCPICGRQFKFKQKYERHKSVHSTEKKFVCGLCNKGLKSKISLRMHMTRHENIKNYNCETCGATFVTSSELINHSLIHKSDKRFACHICTFKAYKKAGLEKHLMRHSGEKPYKCEQCGSVYISKGELAFHMRKHNKEKKYGCTICQQKFYHSPSLNRHMLTLHGVKFKWNDVVDRRVIR